MGLQETRPHAVAPQHFRKGAHRVAVERHVAQDQRMRAGLPRLAHQLLRGVSRRHRDRVAACTACRRVARSPAPAAGSFARATATSPATARSVAPVRHRRSKHRSRRRAPRHRCDRARKRSPPMPIPADSNHSARSRARSARATRGVGCRRAGTAHRRPWPPMRAPPWHPRSMHHGPSPCRQPQSLSPRPRFAIGARTGSYRPVSPSRRRAKASARTARSGWCGRAI